MKQVVVIDIHNLLFAKTGIRTFILDYIKLVEDHSSDSFEYVIVPSLNRIESSEFYSKMNFWKSILSHIETLWWKQVELPLKAIKESADFIVCPDYIGPMWRMKATKVVVFHDSFFWETPEYYQSAWLFYFKGLINLSQRGRFMAIAVSESTQKSIQKHLKFSEPPRVLHNAGPDRKLESSDLRSLDEFEITPKKYFLHVGVMEKRKNLQTIVKAFASLPSEFNGYKLVLVGQHGPRKDQDDYINIIEMINDLNISEKVILPGYMKTSVLEQFYRDAFAYLFPSSQEGFGYPVLEAFSFGIPCITSKCTTLLEIGASASLKAETFESKSWVKQIVRLSKDEQLREDLIELGFKRLKLFNRATYLNRFEEILKRGEEGE